MRDTFTPHVVDSASNLAPNSTTNNPAKRIAIIAGNAPSLAHIDYTRLPPPPRIAESSLLESTLAPESSTSNTHAPKQPSAHSALDSGFDVFRCNQFYFEEQYFLGKTIKYAFANPSVLFEQVYTLRSMHYNSEYEIDNIVASAFDLAYLDHKFQAHRSVFKEIICGADILQRLREFFTRITHNDLYHNKRITSGVYMCAFAIALGYREIYLAGIDLYSAGSTYAFDTHQPNLLKIVPHMQVSETHSPETDLEALELLAKYYGARFYSLCPSSPISKHIPLAPVRADSSVQSWEQIKQSKPKDATRDMLIPPTSAYKRLYAGSADAPFNPLRQNLIYRFVRDILRFPSQTKHYIRAKKRYK